MSRLSLLFALLASMVLHCLGLTLLVGLWHVLPLAPPPVHVIDTQLVMLPPLPATPDPILEPVPPPEPAPLPPDIAEVVPEPQVMPRSPAPPVQRESTRVARQPKLPPAPKPVQRQVPPPVRPISRPPAPARVAAAQPAAAPRRGPPASSPADGAPGRAPDHAPGPLAPPHAEPALPSKGGSETGAEKLAEKGDVGGTLGMGSGGGGGGTARAGLGTGGEGAGTQGSSRRPGAGGAGGEGRGGGAYSPARPLAGGYQVKPTYPDSARRRGTEGTTLLNVHVSETGQVGEVLVAQSAGHQDLDQAAIVAVKKWRFEPARQGNQAIAIWVKLPVQFELR